MLNVNMQYMCVQHITISSGSCDNKHCLFRSFSLWNKSAVCRICFIVQSTGWFVKIKTDFCQNCWRNRHPLFLPPERDIGWRSRNPAKSSSRNKSDTLSAFLPPSQAVFPLPLFHRTVDGWHPHDHIAVFNIHPPLKFASSNTVCLELFPVRTSSVKMIFCAVMTGYGNIDCRNRHIRHMQHFFFFIIKW